MKRTSGMSCACHVSSTWLSLMPFISTYCADHAPYLFFSTPNEKLLGRLVKEKVCANLVLTQPASSHNLRPPPVSFQVCLQPHSHSTLSSIPKPTLVSFQDHSFPNHLQSHSQTFTISFLSISCSDHTLSGGEGSADTCLNLRAWAKK